MFMTPDGLVAAPTVKNTRSKIGKNKSLTPTSSRSKYSILVLLCIAGNFEGLNYACSSRVIELDVEISQNRSKLLQTYESISLRSFFSKSFRQYGIYYSGLFSRHKSSDTSVVSSDSQYPTSRGLISRQKHFA